MKIEMTLPESFELTELLLMIKGASETGAKKSRGTPRRNLEDKAKWAGHFIRKIADAGSKEIDARKGIL